MPTLPQLIEEDIQQIGRGLHELLELSEAATALVIDKGGFLITQRGDTEHFDLTTIAALASGAYLANQTIANLIREDDFNSVYQQGEKFSLLTMNVDSNCLLVVIFGAQVGVGAVKFYATRTIQQIARQMKKAWNRDPEGGLDLSMLNLENPDVVFRKKS
jgi:predicted regulator of Ras-like GTPase activity (Roadblock/LC7/MglB family)